MPKQDWRKHFPLVEPREAQARAIDWICDQFESGHRKVVCELGTGVGKSAIAVTIGSWLEERESGQGEYSPGVTILTSQKVLQTQYCNDFTQARDLRAAANFKCDGPVDGTCGETSRVRKAVGLEMAREKLKCDRCPYRHAKDEFVESHVGVTNYSYHLSEAMYAGEIPARRLLVLDECLRGDAKIWIDTDRSVSIAEVFANEHITHVMSFNNDTRSYDRKKITRKIRTEYDSKQLWVELKFEIDGTSVELVTTDNHKIWTENRGYVRADSLVSTDLLKVDMLPKHDVGKNFVARRSGKINGARVQVKDVQCETCDACFTEAGMKQHQRSIIEMRRCQACKNLFEVSKSNAEQRFCKHDCWASSAEKREESSARMIVSNPMFDPSTVQKMAASIRKSWDSLPDEIKDARRKNFRLAPSHQRRQEANGLEQLVIDIGIPTVKFTGLGDFWVKFSNGKSKNPDFIVEGTRKVIEVRDIHFWHSVEEITEVKRMYAEQGYECLYLTNMDFELRPEETVAKVHKFVYNHDVSFKSMRVLPRSNRFNNKKSHFKYNIEVEGNHNYFANSVLVSNCHNVEDEVRRWTSVEVSEKDAEDLGCDLPTSDDVATCTGWLTDVYKAAIEERLGKVGRKLKKLVKSGTMGGSTVKSLANDNDKLDKRMCQINRIVDKGGRLLISRHDSPDRHVRSIKFQPLDVTELVQETLYSRSSATLLMSATLLDQEVFCRSVGLPGAPYLSIPTPFRSSAFGLSFRPVGRMTRDHIERTLTGYPGAIRRILAENPHHKGIIHTMNYRITRYLMEALSGNKRLLFQSSALDRDRILKTHLMSKDPTVIVSPSMMEGLDLKDDLGRFQIMCKVPYPDMSDPIVQAKDREWYAWRTVRTLVQAVGRGVRSETDWTRTFILDLSFMDLLERNADMVPEYLRKGLVVEEA